MKQLAADFEAIFKRDRSLIVWMLVDFGLSVWLFLECILHLDPSSPVYWRYSDINGGYQTESWWYILGFAVMAIVLGAGHVLISARLRAIQSYWGKIMSKVIEIPVGKRTFRYRFFEILPWLISVGIMVLLFVLSSWSPIAGSIFLLIIVIGSVVKAIGTMFRTIQGYKTVNASCAIDWRQRMVDLENPQESYANRGERVGVNFS